MVYSEIMLIEFGGLPGTGKSTLAGKVADATGAVLLRVDTIEAAMRRNGLTPDQTGVAAYSVAHDIAAAHLARGMTVVADAVNPVDAARAGWRELAAECGSAHVVIETCCADPAEHQRRVETRGSDIAGWTYPSWTEVARWGYAPRSDDRLVVDTMRPVEVCVDEITGHVAAHR
jgi:predicted kinase